MRLRLPVTPSAKSVLNRSSCLSTTTPVPGILALSVATYEALI